MVKEEEEEKKTKVPQGVKKDDTPKISDTFKKMTKVDPQGKKQSDYDRELREFLASQFVPFYVVDSEEFKAFVEELYKTIKCSRTYSRQKALRSSYIGACVGFDSTVGEHALTQYNLEQITSGSGKCML